MNIPHYAPHPLRHYGIYKEKDISKEYYCSVTIHFCVYEFYRYLTPTGWERTAYYFKDRKEAEETFKKIGQTTLPLVTKSEMELQRGGRKFI